MIKLKKKINFKGPKARKLEIKRTRIKFKIKTKWQDKFVYVEGWNWKKINIKKGTKAKN